MARLRDHGVNIFGSYYYFFTAPRARARARGGIGSLSKAVHPPRAMGPYPREWRERWRLRLPGGYQREQRRLWEMMNEGDAWRLYPGPQREAMDREYHQFLPSRARTRAREGKKSYYAPRARRVKAPPGRMAAEAGTYEASAL